MSLDGPLTLCIDGGGTRSRARLVGPGGTDLTSAAGGPCNPSTDRDRALASLGDVWRQCATAVGLDPLDFARVGLAIGAAGLSVPSARNAFLAACPPFAGALAMSDGYAALIGATGGAAGALIIAGTGAAGHRLYADGRSIQRDAWGWVAGDRGSGAWLGRAALRHCLAAVDGLRPADRLARAVLKEIGGTVALSGGWLQDLGPDRLGSLAPTVLDLAHRGDPEALRLRSRAIEHLAALVNGLDAAEVPVYAAGGIADQLRMLLTLRLGREVLRPKSDAVTGCWLVAAGQAPAERAGVFGTTMEHEQ